MECGILVPRPGIKLTSLVLQGRFLTTEQQEGPKNFFHVPPSDAQEEDWGQGKTLETASFFGPGQGGGRQEAPSTFPEPSLTKRKSLKTLRKQELTFYLRIQGMKSYHSPIQNSPVSWSGGRPETNLDLGSHQDTNVHLPLKGHRTPIHPNQPQMQGRVWLEGEARTLRKLHS